MEPLKSIIAVFIKKQPEEITNATLINNKAISGSILIHRMYSAINKAGYNVSNYSNINTFGELVSLLNGEAMPITANVLEGATNDLGSEQTAIGVDIESLENLPITNDFREHDFYTNNFSPEEISYSLLRPNPYETLAGLFSAKEALCKVNNDLKALPFNKINIQHTASGKPIFPNYFISISHTKNYSVAVALYNSDTNSTSLKKNKIILDGLPQGSILNTGPTVPVKIIWVALTISIISIIISVLCLFSLKHIL